MTMAGVGPAAPITRNATSVPGCETEIPEPPPRCASVQRGLAVNTAQIQRGSLCHQIARIVSFSQDCLTQQRRKSMALKGNSRSPKAKAVAYLRTSSAANVGTDKDSDKRQRQAIAGFAKTSGHELVGEFNDAAVSGADHIEARPGFAAMLAYIASNGARTIIVETASRFARDLMVQEVTPLVRDGLTSSSLTAT